MQRQKRTVYRHDDSEYRVSAEEKQMLEVLSPHAHTYACTGVVCVCVCVCVLACVL